MAKPINKNILIDDLASEAGSTKTAAREFLDALSKVVCQHLSDGDAVALPQLVKFEPRDRTARLVRNPGTGEMMHKDACKVAIARPHKALKAAVNP